MQAWQAGAHLPARAYSWWKGGTLSSSTRMPWRSASLSMPSAAITAFILHSAGRQKINRRLDATAARPDDCQQHRRWQGMTGRLLHAIMGADNGRCAAAHLATCCELMLPSWTMRWNAASDS